MRFRAAASTLLLTLSLSLPAVSAPTDLRGPSPEAGSAVTTSIESQTEKGEIKGFMMGQPIQGTIATHTEQRLRTTVLEITDGQPSKVEQRYLEATTTNEMVFNGFEQKQEQKEMEGAVMTLTRDGRNWDATIEGGNVPEEMMGMLTDNARYSDPRMIYPEQPVEVGHKWEVKDDDLASSLVFAAMPVSEYNGKVKYELLEIKEVDGRKFAVISYDMDLTMTMNVTPPGGRGGGPGGDVKITIGMDGEGLIERDLTDFTDTNVFEGEMKFGMEMAANGQIMGNMSAEMDMTSTMVQQVRK